MSYYIYLVTNKKNGTLYTGVTRNLIRRLYQHKQKILEGFTKRYELDRLVYYEVTESIQTAIEREKQLKGWNRAWKIRLIQKMNPQWDDLYERLVDGSPTKAFGDDKGVTALELPCADLMKISRG